MLQEFVNQNYLIIENNVVDNIVYWDGDTTKWTPPQGSIALVQATTPALVWVASEPPTVPPSSVLKEIIGAGDVGFTWDGSVLTTNQPYPQPIEQPTTTGTVTA